MYITTCIYVTLHIYHITTCIYYRIVELDSNLNKNNNCKIYNTEYSKSNVIIILYITLILRFHINSMNVNQGDI